MDGNGDKLRQTLAQLSGVGRILANGSGNIVDIIKNLQNFVTALRDSKQQIVQFQNRLATLSSVVNDSRSDLDAALSNLSVAVGEVQRFIAGTRDKTAEQLQRLANVTQTLVDHRMDVENILHAAPTAFSNGYNIYNPNIPGAIGQLHHQQLLQPGAVHLRRDRAPSRTSPPPKPGSCAANTSARASEPLNFNYLPIPIEPGAATAAPPRTRSSTPNRGWPPAAKGRCPAPPETPPAVSAYTGLN